jgi:glycosyltransferase involved in cell wall biosynthesis
VKIGIVSLPTFEPWNWSNPDTTGIGGSETSHIEMARRLAKRGHEVISFVPMQETQPVMHDGVEWRQSTRIEFGDPFDLWIIYREPELIEFIPEGKPAWLICQDVGYPTLTEERASKYRRIVGLCDDHVTNLHATYPKANVVKSANGIKGELIRELLRIPPERNPHRMMYASSPDRGMEFLLPIFPRIRELVPDAQLHIYYGFDNIDKIVRSVGTEHWIAKNKERLEAMIDNPMQSGVFWHGRTPQPKLLREWMKAGLWCHPSNFTETSCITSMDAQACGAIPVTRALWGIRENVKHGILIEGDVRNELIQARYIQQVYSLMMQPELQETIRVEMMTWALEQFDWEHVADQWDAWICKDSQAREIAA